MKNTSFKIQKKSKNIKFSKNKRIIKAKIKKLPKKIKKSKNKSHSKKSFPVYQSKIIKKKKGNYKKNSTKKVIHKKYSALKETNINNLANFKRNSLPISPDKKYLFLNKDKIYRAIQKEKKYPKMAKMFRIQGTVLVRFTLDENGQISNIKVSGADKILEKSALKTIYKASLYFPKPPIKITISIKIKYVLK